MAPAAFQLVTHRSFPRQTSLTIALAVVVLAIGSTDCHAKPTDYSGLKTDDYLGPVEVVVQVEDEKVFTEGPAVDGGGRVYFTNVPVSKILVWDPKLKFLSVFSDNSHETNGLCFAPNGSILACEGGAGRVTHTERAMGFITVLADKFEGRPLAKPNDLCIDAKERIYFSSRTAVKDPEGENPKGVYRSDPDTTLHRILTWPDIHMPNGLDTSPDDRLLYVIESHPDADHHRDIRVYDLDESGNVSNGRVLIDFYPGRSGDGMCVDALGNLYVAAGLHKTRGTSETLDTKPGIHVISPAGKLLAFRETPEDTITNCTFGGEDLKTLYVTCGSLLLSMPTKIPGKASYRPAR